MSRVNFTQLYTGDSSSDQVQGYIATALQPLLQLPFSSGTRVQDVEVTTSDTFVNHGLESTPEGFIVRNPMLPKWSMSQALKMTHQTGLSFSVQEGQSRWIYSFLRSYGSHKRNQYTAIEKPEVGVDTGPGWATSINNSLDGIDGHDHTTNKGSRITPAALNINADLEMNSNDLTEVRTLSMDSTSDTTTADTRAIYVPVVVGICITETGLVRMSKSRMGLLGVQQEPLGEWDLMQETKQGSVTQTGPNHLTFFYRFSKHRFCQMNHSDLNFTNSVMTIPQTPIL